MKNKNYLSITSLVMIIFVGVFGFGNIANNFKATGTTSASLFLLGALVYFLPLSLIMAEFGAYAKDRSSGIYSWIEIGLGRRAAYYGIWCYFVANIFYLPTLASRVPTYLSFAITGSSNITDSTMAIMSVLALIFALFIGLKYEKGFNKVSTFTGYLSLFVAGIFLVGGIGSYLGYFSTPATTLTTKSLMVSFNTKKELASALGTFAWIIFAFGGSEMVGTYVDRVKDPERNFMRGLLLSSLLIGALYILGIISIAAYGTVEEFNNISLVNAVISGYGMMGDALGYGIWFVKVIGAIYALITLVALVLWSLALTKSVFSEVPEGTFPEWLTKKTKNGTLRNGLIFQTILAFLFILITIYGGSAAGDLYYKIYDMSTIAFILPYLFLGISYMNFRRKGIVSPYQLSKSNTVAYIIGIIITILNIVAIIFSGYDFSVPIGEQMDTIKLYYGGLLLFLLIGHFIKVAKFKIKK